MSSQRAVALIVLSALSPLAGAKMAPPPALPLRAAGADVVLVGKVTAVANKAEPANLFTGDKREMTFATVRVERALMGKPGKSVQVGFMPLAVGKAKPKRPRPQANLKVDQEVLLFLVQHPTKKGAYYLAHYYDVVNKTTPGWKAGVEDVTKAGRLLMTPQKGLASRDANERLLTAILLVHRYKTPRLPRNEVEAVPAAESKRILTILAEADWGAQPTGIRTVTAQAAFYRLGLTQLDGWEQPRNFADFTKAAKKWLKDSAGEYKMMRYVRPRLSTEPDPEPE